MSLGDLSKERLLDLAGEHAIDGRADMDKDALVEALEAQGVTVGEDADSTVHGFQQGVSYPKVPQTPNDFQQLLPNPDLPPENQSAPSPEQLNPHLFPRRL